MTDASWYELKCKACGNRETIRFSELVEAVRRLGHLRKSADPSPELVLELLGDGLLPIECFSCGASQSQLADGDETEWEAERRCQACSKQIDPERLEIFPDSVYCTDCQTKSDQGKLPTDLGYCDRCGGPLESQAAGGSGIARYVLTCRSCGRRQ